MSAATSTPSARTIAIHLNDAPRTLAAGSTLLDLLRELGLADRKGLAIAINDRVVSRTRWPEHALADADRVLVIRATQGG